MCLSCAVATFSGVIISVYRYDFVEVYDGSNEEAELIGRYCGNEVRRFIVKAVLCAYTSDVLYFQSADTYFTYDLLLFLGLLATAIGRNRRVLRNSRPC